MEFTKLYLDWINYLKKKKLYGAWIKDIVTYLEYSRDLSKKSQQYEPIRDERGGWRFNFSYLDTTLYDYKANLKSYFLSDKKSINTIIENVFLSSNHVQIFMSAIRYTINSIRYEYMVSNVHWNDIYKQFTEKRDLKLSRGLSRKLTRTTNKKINYRYKEKVEQPWYSKSYEKYNRKTWKK